MLHFLTFSLFVLLATTFSFSDTYATEKTLKLAKFTQSKSFHLPIDCTINEDCFVMNYVDYGPNDKEKSDHACLNRTYDTHKGTDFAILDGKAMEAGVSVIAPMDGKVVRIRDGEPDQWSTKEQLKEIQAARKECGNAVLIDHGEGLETIYCHMKKGSITVKPDQKIKTGDKIGEVGLSGFTEFPHLHFGVIQDKKVIDPFTGRENTENCDGIAKSLWKKELNLLYQPFNIHASGFSDSAPNLEALERDRETPETLSPDIKILTYWAILYGVRQGDIITLEIKDPNGDIFEETQIIQPKTRTQQFYYIGRNLRNTNLKEGAYTGLVRVKRPNETKEPITKSKVNGLLITP